MLLKEIEGYKLEKLQRVIAVVGVLWYKSIDSQSMSCAGAPPAQQYPYGAAPQYGNQPPPYAPV